MLFIDVRGGKIAEWLSNKGYNNTINDGLIAYFSSQSKLTSGTLVDHIISTLSKKGFTGTVYDMLRDFYIVKTQIQHVGDAERAFFDDASTSFSLTWGDLGQRTWSFWSTSQWGDL